MRVFMKKLRVEIENETRVYLESLNFEIEMRVSQKSDGHSAADRYIVIVVLHTRISNESKVVAMNSGFGVLLMLAHQCNRSLCIIL